LELIQYPRVAAVDRVCEEIADAERNRDRVMQEKLAEVVADLKAKGKEEFDMLASRAEETQESIKMLEQSLAAGLGDLEERLAAAAAAAAAAEAEKARAVAEVDALDPDIALLHKHREAFERWKVARDAEAARQERKDSVVSAAVQTKAGPGVLYKKGNAVFSAAPEPPEEPVVWSPAGPPRPLSPRWRAAAQYKMPLPETESWFTADETDPKTAADAPRRKPLGLRPGPATCETRLPTPPAPENLPVRPGPGEIRTRDPCPPKAPKPAAAAPARTASPAARGTASPQALAAPEESRVFSELSSDPAMSEPSFAFSDDLPPISEPESPTKRGTSTPCAARPFASPSTSVRFPFVATLDPTVLGTQTVSSGLLRLLRRALACVPPQGHWGRSARRPRCTSATGRRAIRSSSTRATA
jgi:hypothetical protein